MKNEPGKACYLPQIIEEYKGNPLIEALPPIYSSYEAAKLLTVDPGYNEGEREFDAQYRFHCIGRLFRYFQPLDTHIDIEQRVSRAIRQGYISKNPVTPDYAARLAQGAAAIREKSGLNAVYSMNSTASGFTVIGMSGVGKTTAMEKVLSLYPQQILHTQYKGEALFLTQLVWAKIDCPFDGSLKGLCLSFFAYVDRILGMSYSKKFSSDRMTVDAALPRMAQIATTHCLGLLVIDEIQHLSQAKSGGSDKMLNFFVTLVNTIGVPVVLIGTTKAMSVLQSEFRQARRGSGQGDLLWDRMKNDLSWEIMLRAMWKNQWTRNQTPLTAELKDILYDESQGIIDIAVKLYAMAQMKAIADGTETITAQTIKEVAAEKLRLVKPMLDALRSGNMKKLLMYEDIKPVNVEDYLAAQSGRIAGGDIPLGKNEILSLTEQAVLKLLEMDISSKVARSAVKKAIGKSVSGQPLAAVVKKAFKIALNMESEKNPTDIDEQDDDLRKAAGESPYENLKKSGFIAESADEF
jgi:hypothetical protein